MHAIRLAPRAPGTRTFPAGTAAALCGWLPRFAGGIACGLLALFLELELGWEVRLVSQAVFDVSPFAHVHWTTGACLGMTAR